MSPMQPVPPRTALQPPRPPGPLPRDPGGIPYEPDYTLPDGSVIPTPQAKQLRVQYIRRYGTPQTVDAADMPDGTTRILFTGGVIINAATLDGTQTVEFATDEAVIWVRNGGGAKNAGAGFVTGGDGKTEVEVYLSGNVIVRSQHGDPAKPTKLITQTLRAEQVYYDATQNRAIAIRGDLEMALPSVPDPFHLRGAEVRRLDLENWEVLDSSVNASKLPSDPGLRLDAGRFTLSQRKVVLRNVFGVPYRDLTTGAPIEGLEQIVTGRNVVTRLANVPVFYLPRTRFDATDPFGPLVGLSFGQNRQFGSSFYTTWDVYELLALRPPRGHQWRLDLDYLSKRGPAGGTDYSYIIPADEPGEYQRGAGLLKLYGIQDHGFDLLPGGRGPQPDPSGLRGRVLWRHQQEILEGMYFQGQLAYLSDKNFLEQFYQQEFNRGPNQETFAYLTYQRGVAGASVLAEQRFGREWVTETNWLPRVDGHLIGQTFLDDLFVYSARASAGYAQLRPSEISPYPVLSTDRRVDTARFDLMQELSAPFALGPVKVVPYGLLDLTEYTTDLTGNEVGRVYGG
ncbi:MAG: LPS assembly protein LptD, partial [Gemmata sp.]